jgi:hypothetical protein
VRKFNPTSKHPDRALQSWQILIAAATNRQTLTYKGLSQIMYRKDAAGVLDKILGHVAFFCSDNKLPALTSIVVGKDRGTPGADIPVNPKIMDREREKVYVYDWYNVYPPSAIQFAKAFDKNR